MNAVRYAGLVLASILFFSCDKNEYAPVMADQEFVISENSPAGTEVGTMIATDQDLGQVLSYEIVDGNDDEIFGIHDSSGILNITDPTNLDYETTTSYILTIVVSDNHPREPLESFASASIEVTDANEFAPILPPGIEEQVFSVEENSPTGTQVGIIEASDSDSSQSLTYRISGGNELQVFGIDPVSGVITVADSTNLDYEVNTSFELTIAVTDDHGENPLESIATIRIDVIDLNEYAPVIEDQVFELDENPSGGQEIGVVHAEDQEAHQVLIYRITGGAGKDFIEIDSVSGALYVSDTEAFDYELHQQMDLVVTVADDHVSPLSAEAAISVQLRNIHEFTDGLMAYLPFSGDLNDHSRNGLNAVTNGVVFTEDIYQQANSAGLFDGIDDYIAMGSDFDYPEKSISLMFNASEIPVYDYDNNPNTSWASLITCDHADLQNGNLKICLSNVDGEDRLWVWKAQFDKTIAPTMISVPVEKGYWHYLTVTVSADSVKLYINGSLAASEQVSSTHHSVDGESYMVVGSSRAANNRYFHGRMDEIYVHRRILEEWEIASLSQAK